MNDKNTAEQIYTIREIAQKFHMQPSTLRYYEDIGLLTHVERNASGKRIYKDMHIHRLSTICCFKNAGMSITQLQQFFRCEENEDAHIDEIVALLKAQKLHVTQEIAQLQKDLAHVQRKLDYYTAVRKSIQDDLPRPDWADYRCR